MFFVFFACFLECVSSALSILCLSDCSSRSLSYGHLLPPEAATNALCEALMNVTASRTVRGRVSQTSTISGCSPLYYLWAQGQAQAESCCYGFMSTIRSVTDRNMDHIF